MRAVSWSFEPVGDEASPFDAPTYTSLVRSLPKAWRNSSADHSWTHLPPCPTTTLLPANMGRAWDTENYAETAASYAAPARLTTVLKDCR